MCDKKIRCVSCGKPIAEEASIQAGFIKITCRCGTVNEIKAEQKDKKPYGDRIQEALTLKGLDDDLNNAISISARRSYKAMITGKQW